MENRYIKKYINKEIKNYQLEIIQRNIIDSLLKVYVIDNEIKIDINNTKKIDKPNFIMLLKVLKVFKQSRKHMLDIANFEVENIFVDDKGNIKLIYLPYKPDLDKDNIDIVLSYLNSPFQKKILKKYYLSKEVEISKFILDHIIKNKNKIIISTIIYLLSLSLVSLMNISYKYIIVTFLYILGIIIYIFSKKSKDRREPAEISSEDRTVILKERKKIRLLFSDPYGNEKEMLISECETKYIGRDQKKCDFIINNKTIGRKHAQIKYINDKLYIEDNDSMNSTYINNTKLKGHKNYEIFKGDKITFANEEYMVYITNTK